MHAVCPAALTAKAATTAIDNKRRAPSTSPSSLALSLSLPLRLWHFTFRFMNGDNDEEAAESKRPRNTRHIFIYAKYTREETNVGRGMKQNQVKYTKIKWQKSKVLLLYSLSLFLYRSPRLVLHLRLAACALRHDTTTVNFIHSWFMNRRRVVFTFFRLCFCCCCWEFQTTSSSNKVPKKFYDCIFCDALFTHSINLCVFFIIPFYYLRRLFLLCVMRVCVCLFVISYDTIPNRLANSI